VAIQAPFIYRRWKVGQLSNKRSELAKIATDLPRRQPTEFNEYKGIIHAHTNLGGHSTGGFEELIAAANANDLDFVLMTEHYSDAFDTAALTLNGVYGKTLFVGGNEIDTADSDRFLMIPGSGDAAGMRKLPTAAVIEKLHVENRLALVTYPEKFKSWESSYDGIEVFSLHTNAKAMNPFTAVFDGIWSFPSYPEMMLASYFQRPDDNLRKFDEIAAKRKVSLFAGTDAHSNIGFHLFGDDAGHRFLNFKFDDYATIFRLARQHVLIKKDKPLTRENLVDTLRSGRSFIGLDALGVTEGFAFSAEGSRGRQNMGGEISKAEGVKLKVGSPQKGRFVIFLDGQKISEAADVADLELDVFETGAYRVEVYLDQLGPPFDKMPWIISNPIYVR
jgi:hypothetical protein